MNYYSSGPLDEIKRVFRNKPVLTTFILINTGVWLLGKFIQVIFYLFNQPDVAIADAWITAYFALPAYLPSLFAHPWTLVSYMFLHLEFWHILFNMLWLFWFGKIFLEFMNSRQFVLTYLLGGLTGGLFYISAFNMFPVFSGMLPVSVALGASASVMAIVTAASFYSPEYSIQLLFIGRIKIIYLALTLFIIDFFAIPTGNPGGHLAHIGGALYGFTYVWMVKYRFRNGFFSTLENSFAKMKSSLHQGKTRPANKNQFRERPLTDDEFNYRKKQDQKKMDEILDKISRGGYDSLTREEKDFLFRSSGKNN
ncbi:MAG: rhomboid family intramembrane serine protease [Bacteroidetes bacterium]|nr:rhomboid family intramembrane serine protease [Bacteroidota bacterium]